MIRGCSVLCRRQAHRSAARLSSTTVAKSRHRQSSTKARLEGRIFLSTSIGAGEECSVPLTLADVHLRHEQLPFAYVFRATLDQDKLISSLREVLRRYPILGATLDFSEGTVPTLECSVDDTVSLSFATSELTLDEWLERKRSGAMQHGDWQSGEGAPTLSPLFDDLSSARWDDDANINEANPYNTKEHVSTMRITYFKGFGTAIGINISHLLGDANSCFRICQVWGRGMRGLPHPTGASNARAEATLTGMVTPTMASLLNLDVVEGTAIAGGSDDAPIYNLIASSLSEVISIASDEAAAEEDESSGNIAADGSEGSHEYVRLEHSSELLHAMKAYGMVHCNSMHHSSSQATSSITEAFVSTNDMIAAMGWLIKRRISERPEWNLSMVVNLRNRGGIDGFSCLEDPSIGVGIFGNALTSVVAELPPSSNEAITMDEVCDAANAIRSSLTNNLGDIQHHQMLSRLGEVAHVVPDQGHCFSTTSWMQFPLWDISFCDKGDEDGSQPGLLEGFYGRPSYALPVGDTYSSIAVPSRCGGCTYKLLAPTREVQPILTLHRNLSEQFIAWAHA